MATSSLIIVVSIVTTCLVGMVTPSIVYDPDNINMKCHRFETDGGFCRIVAACNSDDCEGEAEEVTCVPQGSDEKCLAHRKHAILVGNAENPESLTVKTCDSWFSTCPPDTSCEDGVCCYGLPRDYITLEPEPPLPEDPVCKGGPCKKECPKAYSCQKLMTDLGQVHHCLPTVKPGACPEKKDRSTTYCSKFNEHNRPCKNDGTCPTNMKCCHSSCGGTSCKSPTHAKPGKCRVYKPAQICTRIYRPDKCKKDSHCPRNLKCCRLRCGSLGCRKPKK